MPRIVPISAVTGPAVRQGLTLRKVKEILQKQGLIEPLLVHPSKTDQYELRPTGYDDYRLEAARQLGWDTVLITDGEF